jgi:hypothetical protein
MPAASFLTPESQVGNFDGFVGASHSADRAADEVRRRADRQKMGSFTAELHG